MRCAHFFHLVLLVNFILYLQEMIKAIDATFVFMLVLRLTDCFHELHVLLAILDLVLVN